MASLNKPLVLLACPPLLPHLVKVRIIAKDLVAKGFKVAMVGVEHYRSMIEDEIGVTFVPIKGGGDWCDKDFGPSGKFSKRYEFPPGPEQFAYDMEEIFVKSIYAQHVALQDGIKKLSEGSPGEKIVLAESLYLGAIQMGQKNETLPPNHVKPSGGTIGLGLLPVALSRKKESAHNGNQWLPSLPIHPTEQEEQEKQEYGDLKVLLQKANKRFAKVMDEFGVKSPFGFFFDEVYNAPNRFIQFCIPSAEYPLDPNTKIQFASALPKEKADSPFVFPEWWKDLTEPERKKGKKIIAVSQGSHAFDYQQLILPTIDAFADNTGHSEVLVVVALGKKGDTLEYIPTNVRVADWIPFDELLPHVDVFVTNGGYGAYMHAISNGTPLVVGGDGEDKPEVAARAQYAGMGINLKTGTPTVEAIKNAVKTVLGDEKYKSRCNELQKEQECTDALGVLSNVIQEMA